MRFPTSGNWICPDNLCKPASSRVLVTCISQSSTTPKPIVPIKSAPIRNPAPTTKGNQWIDRLTTSKDAYQQHILIIFKKTQVEANSKGDQEPISTCTRSSISSANLPPFNAIQPLSEPVAARTISRTLSHTYTTPSRSRALAESWWRMQPTQS